VHHQEVQRDQRCQVGHQHVVGERELHEARRRHDREHDDRRTRSERQRRDERQRHEHLLGARRDGRVVGEQPARDQLARDEHDRDRGDQLIAGERVTIEPAVQASEQEPIIRRVPRSDGGAARAGRGLRSAGGQEADGHGGGPR
jgi:hypothetical protein